MTFAPRIVYGAIDLTDAPYSVEFGFDLGNATNIYDVMVSLLRDGTLQSSAGTNNRTLVIPVIVEQPDSGALSSWAADIEVEAGKPSSTLTFSPGDGYGADTVLTTFTADIAHDWDQELEEAGLRRYLLTIPALPFGRSASEVTINWTGPGTQLVDYNSITDWSVVGAGAIAAWDGGLTAGGIGVLQKTTTGEVTVKKTLTLGVYLRLIVVADTPAVDQVVIDGVAVSASVYKIVQAAPGSIASVLIDTAAWDGLAVDVQFRMNGGAAAPGLHSVFSVRYPGIETSLTPTGLDVIDVAGSARSPLALISFTAPTGGAWLITAPDPNVALRDRGAVENLYEKWTVGAGDPVYLPGDYARVTQRSEPQPPRLNPDGIWPQYATAVDQLAYPSARGTAASFFTAGAVSVISASPDLPTGYHSSDITHEEHVLHPGRCGFAVIAAATGLPVATTIMFYPHWWAHAGQ
jgi:hypothetical protein